MWYDNILPTPTPRQMNNLDSVLLKIGETLSSLSNWNNLSEFIVKFHQDWQELGNLVQQELVQTRIEEYESKYDSPRTKKEKSYYTPFGEITLKRKVYQTDDGLQAKVDKELRFPQDKWLPIVLELACALGVSSEFPNSHKLFQKWTLNNLTEKTVANQVEKSGNILQNQEFNLYEESNNHQSNKSIASSDSIDLLYIGVDGVMTPLNKKQGYKEAKVGVIFWNKDHQKFKGQRGKIRQREYVATLKSRNEFRNRVSSLSRQITAAKTAAKTVVIGDGAHWIWKMAQEQFPDSVEILDFFHLSEYIWAVAKAAYPKSEQKQKTWVNIQQELLKKSQWKTVIDNGKKLKRNKKDLTDTIINLERYLTNNKNRIDYQSYLKSGLMIGSGVVESSNRRVVTQRLKQAGMHWSIFGAEGVMALRAAYLSNSNRWSDFWSDKSIITRNKK